MNELRQEFDKTETAKFWMHTTVYFDYEKDQYVSSKIECSHYAQIINAAFMMFQEQHKKIVAYQEELHHGEYLIDTSTLDKPQQSATIALDDDKIKEIFTVNSNELHNNR